MMDLWLFSGMKLRTKFDTIICGEEPSLSDQLNYAKRKFTGLNTIVDERKMNQEKVSKIEYSMRFFTTRNIDSETGTASKLQFVG